MLGAVFGAGIAIAAAFAWMPRDRAPAAAPETSAPPQVPVHVPPGWDSRFLSRLSSVESRLDTLETTRPDAAAPPGYDDGAPESRKAEIGRNYQNDLAYQAENLSKHDQEPRDSMWGTREAEIITHAYNANAQRTYRVGDVDCRSATCTVELVYPTPDDALTSRSNLVRTVEGCHGMSSALTPPKGPGEYIATVIYYCR
jgi:hypothetical protein